MSMVRITHKIPVCAYHWCSARIFHVHYVKPSRLNSVNALHSSLRLRMPGWSSVVRDICFQTICFQTTDLRPGNKLFRDKGSVWTSALSKLVTLFGFMVGAAILRTLEGAEEWRAKCHDKQDEERHSLGTATILAEVKDLDSRSHSAEEVISVVIPAFLAEVCTFENAMRTWIHILAVAKRVSVACKHAGQLAQQFGSICIFWLSGSTLAQIIALAIISARRMVRQNNIPPSTMPRLETEGVGMSELFIDVKEPHDSDSSQSRQTDVVRSGAVTKGVMAGALAAAVMAAGMAVARRRAPSFLDPVMRR